MIDTVEEFLEELARYEDIAMTSDSEEALNGFRGLRRLIDETDFEELSEELLERADNILADIQTAFEDANDLGDYDLQSYNLDEDMGDEE